MQWMHWIIGPQLLGVIFLTAAYIQRWYPPKKINALYGYRTPASMKNQQTWDEANRYSTMLMIRYALIMLAVGLLITALVEDMRMDKDAFMLIKVGLMIASAIGMAVLLIINTEKHLHNTFDK
jgi:uncharacterized membrane protein